MASTDPITGARLDDDLDSPLGGTFIARAVTDLRTMVNPRFPTTTVRDAAYPAAGVTIKNGMSCWTDDAGQWDRIGGNWVLRLAVDPNTATRSYVDGTNDVLTLIGGWSAYGGYHTPRWYLDSSGWMTLSGRVLRTAATFALGSGGTNFQFATLDSSCVPSTAVEPGGGWAALNTTLNTYPVLVRCAAADTALCVVGMDSGTGNVVQNSSFISLDGVRFHI